MKSKERKMPVLPEGVRIVHRTKEIELYGRGSEKYFPIIEALKVLTGTECVQLDATSIGSQIKPFKWGLRSTAKKLGVKGKIKYAEKSGLLYIWLNESE